MRLTVLDIKNSRIPAAMGVCSDDPRLLPWLNEAEERLLNRGLWWCSYAKFRICVTNGCITLPPQIAVIETAAICGHPVAVHDQWFEFLEGGFGTRNPRLASVAGTGATVGCCGGGDSCMQEANHRGYFPSFDDIRGGSTNTPKKLRFICDVADDIGAAVTAYGYDSNGNWVRTNPGGIWQDGETILLSQAPGTDSVTIFSQLTGLQFAAPRKGQAWLYELDTVALTQRLIGQYQYWETRPHYARYFLPGINVQPSTQGTCQQVLVEIIAKLDHLPLVNDSDFMVINSIPALKFMMQAVKKEEDGVNTADLAEAQGFETKAIDELDKQLDHYLGSGRKMGMNFVGASVGSNSPVENFL